MRLFRAFSVIGILLITSACKTDDVREDVPARIVDPTPESRAELRALVSGALNGREVTLADDALSNGSLLIIEPAHLTGRDLRRPEHFRLVLSGSKCVLVHQATEARYELGQSTCTADTQR